jgi:uncharacterized protein (TIGR00255 family)
VRSMTGFGVGETTTPWGRCVVEMRSVNHRHLDLRVKLPREMNDQQVFVEQMVRSHITRGKVDVSVYLSGGEGGRYTLDREKALRAMGELRALAQELGDTGGVSLALLTCVPELFVSTGEREPEVVRGILTEAVGKATKSLDASRVTEGSALAADLQQRHTVVTRYIQFVEGHAPGMAERLRTRLRERIEYSMGTGTLDSGRLAQEVALTVDRSDISEELTRLNVHGQHLSTLLTSKEVVGRKMDFVLQEMAREANTLGAKASDAKVSVTIIELKTEIERMREQAQNVE